MYFLRQLIMKLQGPLIIYLRESFDDSYHSSLVCLGDSERRRCVPPIQKPVVQGSVQALLQEQKDPDIGHAGLPGMFAGLPWRRGGENGVGREALKLCFVWRRNAIKIPGGGTYHFSAAPQTVKQSSSIATRCAQDAFWIPLVLMVFKQMPDVRAA